MPCLGVPDDEFDRPLRGRVGEGQGVQRESFIEAVNHCRLQDRGCVFAQRCIEVITVPSHLASRYMRLCTTTDLTWQPFTSLKIVGKCSISISCPSFAKSLNRDSYRNSAYILTF